MKKLKYKFKRAVYNLFKNEILKITSDLPEMIVPLTYSFIDFHEIKGRLDIEALSEQNYQYEIEKLKKELCKKAMDFIIIEENNDPDPSYRHHRRVAMSLFVGKKE